jgi:hypothetical protein
LTKVFEDHDDMYNTLKYWLNKLQIDDGFRIDVLFENELLKCKNSKRNFKIIENNHCINAMYKLVNDVSVIKFNMQQAISDYKDFSEYILVGILLEKKGVIEDFSKRLDDDNIIKIALELRYPDLLLPEG